MSNVSGVSSNKNTGSIFGFDSADSNSRISMTQSDAQFFINLTQNNNANITNQTVATQAQDLLNNGANAAEVKQNVQISETLLNAINTAKENNQPLRIDFDQNVSVVYELIKTVLLLLILFLEIKL